VFRAPQTLQTRFDKSERFEFDLVLIGHALDFLPYFVLSFRQLAAEGLGLNRARCTLEKVEQIVALPVPVEGKLAVAAVLEGVPRPRLIYSAQDQVLRATESASAGEWIKARAQLVSRDNGDGAVQIVNISFLTPTFLRAGGEVVRQPEFHHLFKRLRDRINALGSFFGDGPLDADFHGLGERAEKIRTVSVQTDWVDRFRTSSRTRQRHELSGFIGDTTYEGELREFLPWLALGELAHVGRHAAWGNGWYRVAEV
jgi:hypothetical protein